MINTLAARNTPATRSLMRRAGLLTVRERLVVHCLRAAGTALDASATTLAALEPTFELVAAGGHLPAAGGVPRVLCLFLLAGDAGNAPLQTALSAILFTVAGACDVSRAEIASALHDRRVLVAFARAAGLPAPMLLSCPGVQPEAEARSEVRRLRRARRAAAGTPPAGEGAAREAAPVRSTELAAGDATGFCRWFNQPAGSDPAMAAARPAIWRRCEAGLLRALRRDNTDGEAARDALCRCQAAEAGAAAAERRLRGLQWLRAARAVDVFASQCVQAGSS